LVIRADGDARVGLGHLIRSLALAQAIEARFELVFATRCQIPALHRALEAVARLAPLPPSVAVADEPAWIAEQFPDSAVVVLDGYQFDQAAEAALRADGRRVVSIDDVPSRPFAADLIINHAGGLSPDDYQAGPHTRFALGPAYALLRPEFLAAARARQQRPGAGDLLICLGGADPDNQVLAVARRALQLFPRAVLQVVLGAAYAFRAAFDAFAAPHGARICVHANLGPAEMVSLMRRCATAILAPSGVAYEYASVGGLLFLHPIADNQRNLHRFLVDEGVGSPFAGPLPQPAALARMTARQQELFDGQSGERLLSAIEGLL
jgi:UDP-2,4-diacetamido-2,4,6-trideoxy-beta-L-altropyranose hydrolase